MMMMTSVGLVLSFPDTSTDQFKDYNKTFKCKLFTAEIFKVSLTERRMKELREP